MNFGYARVSAKDQNLDTQLEQLRAAGVDRIFQEKISGAATSRPELDKMLSLLREGDTVTVNRLSRLGRNTAHVIQLVEEFSNRDVRFVSLDLGVDTNTPAGRMVLSVFAALAQFERESNGERRQAGIELAKAQGKHMGRRPGLDKKRLDQVRLALKSVSSAGDVAKLTGLPLATAKRYKKFLEEQSAPISAPQ